MKCPKCSTEWSATADAAGLFVCPKCGAKLRPRASAAAAAPAGSAASLETLLAELRAVRRMQEETLALLRSPPAVADPAAAEDGAPPPAPLRARRRKTVLLIDDDATTRDAALKALEQAEVPTRCCAEGSAALSAIADEKPDVIVMELDVGGSMGGKDVVNMIKATMEWVDIPIVLHTRLPIESQKEARTIHGADELVPKGPGSTEALVARVIQVFRRG